MRKGLRGLSSYERKQTVLRILKAYSGLTRSSILWFLGCVDKDNYKDLNETLEKLLNEKSIKIVEQETGRKRNVLYQIQKIK